VIVPKLAGLALQTTRALFELLITAVNCCVCAGYKSVLAGERLMASGMVMNPGAPEDGIASPVADTASAFET